MSVSPKIQRSLMIVTTVIGMFNTDTSRSANARFRRKPLEIVRRFFRLVKTKNKLILPRIEVAQMKISTAASTMEAVSSVILRREQADRLKRTMYLLCLLL